MRPNAIYSKSGKGVQEASGKTSLLKREHRAVLAAIDGRATLADVAQKSGNEYDAEFQRLIVQLDKDGFIREVSSGAGAGPAAGAAKPAGKLDTAIDLDFSSLASSQKANTAPQPTRPPPPPAPKAPAIDMAAKAAAERRAKEQESALHRARKEAEEKALAERERQRAEAEAKVRAETEAKLRVEAEKKLREETAHKARADAVAKAQELKAKLDAERKAREEAERRLEEERRAREEIERKAREEAERIRQEAEEQARREMEVLRQQIEEDRKAREEAERRSREEMSRARLEADERARRAEERKHKPSEPPAEAPPAPPRPQPAPGSDKFADSLFADLESFNKREEESRQKDEETERRAREEEERLARENEERERKFREEEDKRARESDERSRKAKEEEILAAKTRGDMPSGDSSLQDRRAKALKRGPGVAAAYRRQERNWGKPVTITLLVILGAALGALHVIPISTADYEKAAREALGQPVRVGSGRISLWRGVHYEFRDVRIGERVRIAEARAFPRLDALFDEKKILKLIELEGAALPQDALGEALFAKANGENFTVGRVVAKQLKLEGPLPLPPLDVDAALDAAGALRLASLAGPENLVANL